MREVCSETFRERTEWNKRCTMPADMKMELMEEVLLKGSQPARDNQIDRITFRNKTDRSRQEAKIVRMKAPAQSGQDRIRSKVNFQFVSKSKTTTSRPVGWPYVYADSLDDKREGNRNVAALCIISQPSHNYIFRPSQGSPSTVLRTPADTRRYAPRAQRFPVRPAPVNGLARSKPRRSDGGDDKHYL